MAAIKAYTDISQSKKLAEILPPESADGFYEAQHNPITNEWEDILFTGTKWASKDVVIPAWSLAALLDILPDRTCVYKKTYKNGLVKYQGVMEGNKELLLKDNPIDVCYEMIVKLHELSLL